MADQIDLQSLTQQDIEALMQQGIMPEQIADLAKQQGQPIPPIVQQMMSVEGSMAPNMEKPATKQSVPSDKSSKYPAMMNLPTYAKYKNAEQREKKERKLKMGAHKPTVYGYVFSDLLSEEVLRDIKKTQGSFLIGVNLNNLFNEIRGIIVKDETKSKQSNLNNSKKGKKTKKIKDNEVMFKRVGEYVNVDFDKILDRKMGYRGSDIPLLPEKALTDTSTFSEVINESRKYADMGYDGRITPLGLLTMTRMLYKYRKNNAQWMRVATILELIYKYLSNNQSRIIFFKNKDEIGILSLMDLEEFYNTDHIFMTETELHKFKEDLDFYKYDSQTDIMMKIRELRTKPLPII